MRAIERSPAFKRDTKREAKGQYRASVEGVLMAVSLTRASDTALIGDWVGYRECHLKPDLLLIYQTSEAETLRLLRLGSHSQLFG